MKALLLIPLLLLAACDSRPIDQRGYTATKMDNIPELRGCVYIRIDGGTDLRIIRCPNSAVDLEWTTGGKAPKTNRISTLDGE